MAKPPAMAFGPTHADAPAAQRGSALLAALAIVALIVTAAVTAVWQQWQALQVEAAERERTQAGWLLDGAVAWAQQLLDDDARGGGVDHLGEAWAQPLAEVPVSSWLAGRPGQAGGSDRAGEGSDSTAPAFLSGRISDLQARYNLRNLVSDSMVQGDELERLEQLCVAVGVEREWAGRLATALNAALVRLATQTSFDAPLLPPSVQQLGWLGVDEASARRLAPHLVLLPVRTPVNVNTASAEVLIAAITGLDAAGAHHLLALRERRPFRSLRQIERELPELAPLDVRQVAVASAYFEVQGRLRLDQRVLERRWLVERRGGRTRLLQREPVVGGESS